MNYFFQNKAMMTSKKKQAVKPFFSTIDFNAYFSYRKIND